MEDYCPTPPMLCATYDYLIWLAKHVKELEESVRAHTIIEQEAANLLKQLEMSFHA